MPLSRSAVLFALCALVAGCTASSPSPSLTAGSPNVAHGKSGGYTVRTIFNFNGASGSSTGSSPTSGVFSDRGDALYGTANGGGAANNGVLFKLTKGGDQSILHSFGSNDSGDDGEDPEGGLTNVEGSPALYGTTFFGGTNNGGTVYRYSVFPAKYETLRAFTNADGVGLGPAGGLIWDPATHLLYGTNADGQDGGRGAVFSMTRDGVVKLIQNFKTDADGRRPLGSLFVDDPDRGGYVYGTTFEGGTATANHPRGCGIVFVLDPERAGSINVLHKFSEADGCNPNTALVRVKNDVWGTTTTGGKFGFGVIYSIADSRNEFDVRHDFAGAPSDGTAGSSPLMPLPSASGFGFLGTTKRGGSDDGGTVFEFASKKYEIVHSFSGKKEDGSFPDGTLAKVGNRYIGTTRKGGAQNGGTIFEIDP